ncbi:MAG: EF-hand domain-containing protein [Verrucomicrobiae bacterium]|nr:EF-hand domain-containing protein [Verrucomicrobiae bacterium]
MSSISAIGSAGNMISPTQVFDTADVNKDGKVTQEELAKVVPNASDVFSLVDTDGDGSITKTEDDAWLEKMKENGPGAAGQSDPIGSLIDQIMQRLNGTSSSDSGTGDASSTDDSSVSLEDLVKQLIEKLKEKQSSASSGYNQSGSLMPPPPENALEVSA